MKLFSWNYRGIGNSYAIRSFRQLVEFQGPRGFISHGNKT